MLLDKSDRQEGGLGRVRLDVACETELHPQQHVDKEYEWAGGESSQRYGIVADGTNGGCGRNC